MAEPNAETLLYPVEFALLVEGRGLTALCCFPDPKKAVIRVGDPIEFVRPDGSILQTTVKALSMVMDARPGLIGLELPDGIQKDDLPRVTHLRLIAANAPRVDQGNV
jgi:hypothetical protein